MTMFSRSDRTILGRWFWTVDRTLLGLILALTAVGLIAVAAASPAAAQRLSGLTFKLGDFYFLKRQIMWVGVGMPLMIGVSMMSKPLIRRLAVLGTAACIAALIALPVLGAEVNGAVRWINLGGMQLQPSEFLKPMFIVTTAWILSSRFEDEAMPSFLVSGVLLALVGGLLVMQPDYGQTMLIAAIWIGQAFLAGLGLGAIGMVALAGVGVIALGYFISPHISSRIDRFFTGEGDTYQIDKALDALRAGGLFGTGPGEGQAKFSLPEPHTDYIFAVIGEEFGMIACLAVASLFLAVVIRVFTQLMEEDDPFVTLAAAGLAAQIGLQAFINMGVATSLLPSKGMTLPFISHGGSSFLALCIGTGMLLSLTRRSRFLKSSPFVSQMRSAA